MRESPVKTFVCLSKQIPNLVCLHCNDCYSLPTCKEDEKLFPTQMALLHDAEITLLAYVYYCFRICYSNFGNPSLPQHPNATHREVGAYTTDLWKRLAWL